jgi:thiol-disulfide isomerase/thioredoxin
MRLLGAAAVSLVLGLLLAFAEDKSDDTPAARSDQLASLKKKFDVELKDLKKRGSRAKDPSEQMGINEEIRELVILTSRDALKIAEEDPKDSTGFDAMSFILLQTSMYGGGQECNTAIKLLNEHHFNSARMADLIPALPLVGAEGQKLLLALTEKSGSAEVKALALFFQGNRALKELESGEVEHDKQIETLITKATNYFEKAAKEAPNAKLGSTTVSKQVAAQLDYLKHLTFVSVGKPAPDVEGSDLGGKSVKLSSYWGKVVLLDIWATWCGPCRSMIPHERQLVEKLKKKPFALLSVSCDRNQEALTKFLESESMPWDHWFDGPEGAVAKTYQVRGFPSLFLIDHAGVLRKKWLGRPDNAALEKAIEEAVEAAEKAKG